MEEIIAPISSHFIECKVSNATNAEVIWKSNFELQNSDVEFCSKYSYLISNTGAFSNIVFNHYNEIHAQIERYGGSGLGGNGGGARTANISGAQVKGIGANILVGEGVPPHHGYGGLDIYSAVVEIILTHLLNRITPCGAINNKGLILIDRHAGSYDGKECWAVLLVREIPLRPGHFLHAGYFKPKSSAGWIYKSEESRIRTIYRDIDKAVGSTNFVIYLGKFLAAAANQFAFARMNRLLHGGLSESNMSMDGKWLDVPLAGFVPAGSNWSQQSDVYFEAYEALEFIRQCTYNYTKYTRKQLNPQPLYKYYIEQLDECKRLHCTFLLGMDSIQMEAIFDHEEISKLCKSFEDIIISRKTEAIKSYAQLDDHDPLDNEIISIWFEIASNFRGLESVTGNAAIFRKILHKLELGTTRKIIPIAIQSIKRLLLCRFFYLKNSVDQARSHFSNVDGAMDSQLHTTSYIEKRLWLINWIYEKNDEPTVTLISIPDLCIKYIIENKHYSILIGKEKFKSETILDIKHLIVNSNQKMIYLDFNFTYYFEKVIDLLCKLEMQ